MKTLEANGRTVPSPKAKKLKAKDRMTPKKETKARTKPKEDHPVERNAVARSEPERKTPNTPNVVRRMHLN